MAGYNRIILFGNLTRDPELKYLPSNTAVCEFGLAVNRRYRDKDGNQRDEVCFVDISAFGKQAETINQYMTKGKPILIEGRLKLDTWQAQDGSKRSKHSVVVDNFQFVGGREGAGGPPPGGAPAAGGEAPHRESNWQGQPPTPQRRPVSAPAGDEPGYPPDPAPPTGENIPF